MFDANYDFLVEIIRFASYYCTQSALLYRSILCYSLLLAHTVYAR